MFETNICIYSTGSVEHLGKLRLGGAELALWVETLSFSARKFGTARSNSFNIHNSIAKTCPRIPGSFPTTLCCSPPPPRLSCVAAIRLAKTRACPNMTVPYTSLPPRRTIFEDMVLDKESSFLFDDHVEATLTTCDRLHSTFSNTRILNGEDLTLTSLTRDRRSEDRDLLGVPYNPM